MHPDSPVKGLPLDHPDSNCVGKSFLQANGDNDDTDQWYEPLLTHGTHVAGTIATANNFIAGMLPDGSDVCFIIAQVFGTSGSSSMSTVIEATEWTISMGASVVNLSLGGSRYSQTADSYFSQIEEDGVIVIAAAGNNGRDDYSYPASYPWVRQIVIRTSVTRKCLQQRRNLIRFACLLSPTPRRCYR